MALPVVLVNSATGSDTAASGAGPATALTGTAASTSADGLVVTLDGSPSLTGVATDGSHVIYLADTTAGARNFGKITAKDDVAKTVTVSNAFGLSLTGKSWAIGGKRLSISSTTSIKLLNNNNTTGDALAGWKIQLESGFTDTFSATQNIYTTGNTTDGPVTILGEAGGTRPIITFTNNAGGFVIRNVGTTLRYLEGRNTNATKTASTFISLDNGKQLVDDVLVTHSTNKFFSGIVGGNTGQQQITNCEIANCASTGIKSTVSDVRLDVSNCYIHNNDADGIELTAPRFGASVTGCIIYSNAAHGIDVTATPTDSTPALHIRHNTIDSNTGAGINIQSVVSTYCGLIENNELTSNGTYGLATTLGSASVGLGLIVRNNAVFNNTSGAYNPSGLGSGDQTNTPSYTNAAGGDFSIGTNHKAKGYPLAGTNYIGSSNTTSTYSYVDIGAAQRQEAAAAGGGLLTNPGMAGGMRG